MLRWFNWRWKVGNVLVSIIVAYASFGLVIHGCGGGGGGGRPSQPPTEQSARSAARVVSISVQRFTRQIRRAGSRSKLLPSRQSICPNFTSNWDGDTPPNPLVITIDYGEGCEDETGEFFSGSVTLTMRDPQISEEGEMFFSSINISFNNFSDGEETINGNLSLRPVSPSLVEYQISYDLRYSNDQGCNQRLTFNGTVRTDLPISEDFSQMIFNGTGTYSGPSGNFNLEMIGVAYDLMTECDYPIAGTLRISGGGNRIALNFTSECGLATISINDGSPSQVSLPDLEEDDPYDPCF
ncbi:MAG: hypothetical protein NZ805_13560 [Armatimonadetes bacterium]|nr:hypothetical protein [Armatimonadota bacterium]MDW8030004.1 hypothetical protein [Armatimonadota bacterium]